MPSGRRDGMARWTARSSAERSTRGCVHCGSRLARPVLRPEILATVRAHHGARGLPFVLGQRCRRRRVHDTLRHRRIWSPLSVPGSRQRATEGVRAHLSSDPGQDVSSADLQSLRFYGPGRLNDTADVWYVAEDGSALPAVPHMLATSRPVSPSYLRREVVLTSAEKESGRMERSLIMHGSGPS